MARIKSSTVRKRTEPHALLLNAASRSVVCGWLVSLVLASHCANAKEWTIHPYLTLSESYSDNMLLRQDGQNDSGFISQISPGINVTRDTRKSKFTLSYAVQGIIRDGDTSSTDIFNNLQMSSRTELAKNLLYVDSVSTIGQANTNSNSVLAFDNISRTVNNSTEYRTFMLSPYINLRLDGYATGTARFSYATVSNSGGNSVDISSTLLQESFSLTSGNKFGDLGWGVSFNNQDNIRSNESKQLNSINGDVNFQSAIAQVSYRIFDDYRVFVQGSRYSNQLAGTNNRNGSYWNSGISWVPSPRFNLSIGYGPGNKFASLQWTPSLRTSLQVIYRDSKYGGYNNGGFGMGNFGSTNFGGGGFGGGGFGGGIGGIGGGGGFGSGGIGSGIGGIGTSAGIGDSGIGNLSGLGSLSGGGLGGSNSGSTWTGLLRHTTRTSQWQASYLVSTTTIQDILLNQNQFTTPIDSQGQIIGDPIQAGRAIDLASFTNDTITSKRAQILASVFFSKNTMTLSMYQDRRTYDIQKISQDLIGGNLSWVWRFSRIGSSVVSVLWQQSDTANNTSNLSLFSWRLTRNISKYVNGYLEFRHTQQSADKPTSLANSNEYTENRITATVSVRY